MNGKKTGRRKRDYTHIFLILLFLFGIMVQSSQASSLTSTSTYTNPDGLIGYWDFAQCTGTSATDRGDWGNTGTLTNSPTWVSGKYGCGLNFAIGGNTYVNVGNNSILNPTATLTISAWVKPQTFPSATVWYYVVYKGNNYEFGYETYSNSWNCKLYNSSGNNFAVTYAVTPTVNTWYHIACTMNSTKSTLYLDGVQVAQSTIVNNGLKQAVDVAIIGHSATSFNGTIDEVKIWNRALSAEEVYIDYLGTYANIEKWYQGLSTGNITSTCTGWATSAQANQISTDVNTTKSNTATLLTNANQISTNVNATATSTQANQISTDVNTTKTNTNTIITNITTLSTNMSNNFTATNNLISTGWGYENRTDEIAQWIWQCVISSQSCYDAADGLVNLIWGDPTRSVQINNPEEVAPYVWLDEYSGERTTNCTNCEVNITVNNTNTTNNYNSTEIINNSYPVNIIVNNTNSTINNSVYLQTQLDNATMKRVSREVAFYLPDYQAQYNALDNFNHPILFGYALPFPYITIIILAVFFIICTIAGVSFGLWFKKKIGLDRRFK